MLLRAAPLFFAIIGSFSAAITTDGSLYTWGEGTYGKLGNGTTKDRSEPEKIMDNVASVSLGTEHSAAITKDGNLYTWGYNLNGQLGLGEKSNRYENPTPIKVPFFSSTLKGDANGDGDVNSRDAALILRHAAGYSVKIDLDAADVTGDGDVNSRDAALILRKAAGYDVSFS